MRVLIFGGSGMLGHKLFQSWKDKFDISTTIKGNLADYQTFGLFSKKNTFEGINVQDLDSVKKVIEQIKPDVVFNAVGLIKQLPTSKDVVKTLSINSIFPHQLAEFAEQLRFRLINVSTDCVFNGEKGNYKEVDNSDAYDLYGKSKNLGEVAASNCLTIRTSIIGRELKTSHSLVEWFLSNQGQKVRGFSKAIYSGFPTIVLGEIVYDLIVNYPDLNGLYHVSSEPISKLELLQLINQAYDAKVEIEPSEDFVIDRSLDSTKFRNATGFNPQSWERMIEQMASDNGLYRN
jgi:dTDP-4-dehydrorhamnose reductase